MKNIRDNQTGQLRKTLPLAFFLIASCFPLLSNAEDITDPVIQHIKKSSHASKIISRVKCLSGNPACEKNRKKRKSFMERCKSSHEKCKEQHEARIRIREKARMKCKADPVFCSAKEQELKERRKLLSDYIRNNS